MPLNRGWETFPEHLSLHTNYAHLYNFSAYNFQLHDNSKRLFSNNDEGVSIKVIELGGEGTISDPVVMITAD